LNTIYNILKYLVAGLDKKGYIIRNVAIVTILLFMAGCTPKYIYKKYYIQPETEYGKLCIKSCKGR